MIKKMLLNSAVLATALMPIAEYEQYLDLLPRS